MAKVQIYGTQVCPYCVKAKELFKIRNVKYTEIMVDSDTNKMSEMLKRSNRARSVPQIFINDTHIGGYDDLYALDKEGKLDEMLND